MLRIPDSIYLQYVPNKEIGNAIKKRLGELLHTNQPEVMLAQMVERRFKDFPGASYTTVEDQVLQSVIICFEDRILDRLWVIYNTGYFEQDTRKFLEIYPWAKFESLSTDVEKAFNVECVLLCK